jgi:hypothetical protein
MHDETRRMRQHATQPKPVWHAGLALASLTFAWLACMLLLVASPTLAATVTDRPLLFSFDGSGSEVAGPGGSAGTFVSPNKVAIDNSSGAVYVADEPDSPFEYEAICKFNLDGSAVDFIATGKSCLFGPAEDEFGLGTSNNFDEVRIAVDNSGGPNQGRIYAIEGRRRRLTAYAPSGVFLWEVPETGVEVTRDVAVDASGHPWVLDNTTVREFADDGSPPVEIASFTVPLGAQSLDADGAGNVYIAEFGGVKKYVGGVLNSVLDASPSSDVFVDGPTGRIFTRHRTTGDFNEYASGSLLATYGTGAINSGGGIAYDAALDRVYVSDRNLNIVEALGPPMTGTVPDPTIEATTVLGPGAAEFHGQVNPQGVANAYYFEWSSGVGVFRSPQQSLPEDSSPHAVSFKATDVSGNREWTVHLVTLNTADGLRQVSGTASFTPPKATEVPEVTIEQPGEITSTTAKIKGAVNPRGDSVGLTIEVSQNESCAPFPVNKDLQSLYIPGGEINTPILVEYQLKKLTPGKHYCVRMRSGNSFQESSPSETKEFDTPSPPPSQVSTAFAGPRTDTTARINGRVNPEGKVTLKYQFEWSEDGATWTQLPVREIEVNASEPIVVADELTGLKPATTYHYRLGMVENETGPATETGEAKTFATRSAAEMTIPPNGFGESDKRGIELVNSPNKGDQNLFLRNISGEVLGGVPLLAEGGDRSRWTVLAGAPGSPSGEGGQFLAERTGATEAAPNGWQSTSIEPLASQQVGEGSLVYNITAASPEQTHFVADLRASGLSKVPRSTLTRLDGQGHEEVLGTFEWTLGEDEIYGVDMTDDGAHVLTVDPETHQLVDIGSGSRKTISLMPGTNAPSTCGLRTFRPSAGLEESFVGGPQWRSSYHMMASTDANLVYFRAKPDGECGAPWGLYVRDRKAEKTTLIDPGVPGHNVEFIRAKPDGSEAVFITASRLDPADGNSGFDLYRWDDETKEAHCLSCIVPGPGIRTNGNVVTPVMVSADLSHAYFESTKRLVTGQGVVGSDNIYALTGGAIHFVADLGVGGESQLASADALLSADGNVLLFNASAEAAPRLTADAVQCGGGCVQLYRYDDRDGSMDCLSCNLAGSTTLSTTRALAGVFGISADGSTAAFVTPQALTPRDVNGGADVYEWRNGVRRLVTDGVSEAQTGTAKPGVWGVSADGSNILLSVLQPDLTGFERDNFSNLYTARLGGGFAPSSPPAHCEGESCQGQLQASPKLGQLGSSGSSGGNVPTPMPCRKGKVRRHGRCASRHPHKHKHRHRAGANRGRSL